MTKTLEENQAFVKALYAVVEEKGDDYVYEHEDCKYIIDGCPACLIGAALVKVGHTPEEILNWDGVVCISGPNGEAANVKLLRMGYDADIAHAARKAQYVQDEQGTWGDAVDAFIEYLVDRDVWLKYDPPIRLCNGF